MKRTSLTTLGIGALALVTVLGVARVSDAQPKPSLEQRIAQLEGQNKAQQDQIAALKEADKAEKAEMNAKNTLQGTQIAALIDQNKAQQNLLQTLVHQGNARDGRIHALEVKVGAGK
jgi:Tfp pilus assembly protein PilN